MRKYIYMIDYFWQDERADQCECEKQDEVIDQLKYLKSHGATITNVKLVENEDRYHEEEISYTLGQEVKSLLGYKPIFMITRNKGEIL